MKIDQGVDTALRGFGLCTHPPIMIDRLGPVMYWASFLTTRLGNHRQHL